MKKFHYTLALVISFCLLIPVAHAVDYPFQDDMEGSVNWTEDPPWELIDTDSQSPSHSWTDSPGYYYANNADVSLTLATPIDLSAAESPQLRFWHKYQIEPDYDYGYVEVSIDGGATWETRAAYSGYSGVDSDLYVTMSNQAEDLGLIEATTAAISEVWISDQVDLTDFSGQSNVLIRFRLETDKSIVLDGWTIDDVLIAEQPHPVTLFEITDATTTSLNLSWTKNLDPDFVAYKIFRSITPGVDIDSKLVATIDDQDTTAYTDVKLQPGTTYYYRVFVYNRVDLYAGSKEENGTTLPGIIYYFADFEDNFDEWTLEAPWGPTEEDAVSGTKCLTDSPGADYQDSRNISASITLDLNQSYMPVLRFWTRYKLEHYADYGYVEVSTNNGANWYKVYFATGLEEDWHEVAIDLSQWISPQTLIRFRLTSNASVPSDGWYIDDVWIGESEADLGFPFFDNMEGPDTASNWYASSWGQVYPDRDGGYCFTDSPTGYHINLGYTALTQAGTIDLSFAQSPQLVFWHRYSLGRYDHGKVQVGYYQAPGWHYDTRADYVYSVLGNWTKVQLDLSAYAGKKIRLRFLMSDSNTNLYTNDGWFIDDVAIQEGPVDVTLGTPANPTKNSLDISWSENADANFREYRLYRANTSAVSNTSTLAATFTDQQQTTFQDNNLDSATTYYYRMYLLDQFGIWSSGSNVVSGTTLIAAVPLPEAPVFDDFENGPGHWASTGSWDISPEDSHSGLSSFTDSPWGNYSNNTNTWIRTSLDLSKLKSPLMRFWTRYKLEHYADYGYVEVSTNNGANWYKVYFATGLEEDWHEVAIDLSQWISPQTLIRFRLTSNASVPSDGWYIDDVWIGESEADLGFPFFDNMEGPDTASNWYASSWGQVYPDRDGGYCFTDSPTGYHINLGYTALTQAGTIDLSFAQSPQLVFWHRYSLGRYDHGKVQVGYYQAPGWHYDTRADYVYSVLGNWTKVQLDLSAYAGKKIRLRFLMSDSNTNLYTNDGWFIDDVAIQEGPVDVTLGTPANPTKNSLDISWSENADANFREYRLYRANTSAVSNTSTLAATFTDQQQTTFQDNNLDSATTYYYRMYLLDQFGIWSSGSNVVSGTTLIAAVPLPEAPVFDDFENGPGHWASTGSWDISPEDSHSGLSSFTDSPWGNYSNNTNTWIRTSLDLSKLKSPLMRFWTRYKLEHYVDYGYVEVSTNNGANWYKVYFATGLEEDWHEVAIDLSQWISPQTLIRFRLTSNASVPSDGWYIDDVWIGESEADLGFPFFDNMEGPDTASNWYASSWGQVYPDRDGGYCFTDSPTGYHINLGYTALTQAGTIDLSFAQSPQLVFWHRYSLGRYDHGKVQVGYYQAPGWHYDTPADYVYSSLGSWTKVQLDLSAYAGKKIRLRFLMSDSNTNLYTNDGWFIDDVYIGENLGSTLLVDWCALDRPISLVSEVNVPSAEIFGWVEETGITDDIGQGVGIIAQLGYGPIGTYPGDDWVWVDAVYVRDVGAGDLYDEYAATVTVAKTGQYAIAYRFSSDGGNSWIYADTDGVDIGSGNGTNGYSPSKAGILQVTDQSLPDLIVQSIETDPQIPSAGEDATIYVTVKNQGTADAGRFFVDYYQDLGSLPVTGQAGVLYWSVDALAAGATHELTGTAAFVQDGNYRQYAQADTDEQVVEINETNNIIGPVDICIGGCLSDLTADGAVDGMDLEIFAANFGAIGCRGNCPGDSDNNDVVDGRDLTHFIFDYGRMSIFQCR